MLTVYISVPALPSLRQILTILTHLLACYQLPPLAADSPNKCRGRYSSIEIITSSVNISTKEYSSLVKLSTSPISINPYSAALGTKLARSSHSLVLLDRPDVSTIEAMVELHHHVIVIGGMECEEVKPSKWNVDLYCWNGNGFVEKYEVGGHVVRREIKEQSLEKLLSQRIMRRSNLMGTEFRATSLESDDRTEGLKYGDKESARISGSFGDLFNVMRERLNFTFSLKKPDDNKWGGHDLSRPSGWNGMTGLIAEGGADFGIGDWTPPHRELRL